jgi:Fur family ferric uptake transcriptional regulator
LAVDECYYREILTSKGIKGTRQRIDVMAVLFSSAVPLTADDIYIHIRDGGGEKLSLSTVYRILDTLGQKEIVAKTGLIEGGKALYEIVSGVHRHNLICIKCHKLIPLGDCPLGDFEKNLEDTTGFRISGHKFEIYGVCPDCRQIKQ